MKEITIKFTEEELLTFKMIVGVYIDRYSSDLMIPKEIRNILEKGLEAEEKLKEEKNG